MKDSIIILLLPVLGCLLTYYALLRRKALAISTSAGLVAALLETCALGCGIVVLLVEYYRSSEFLLFIALFYAWCAFTAAPFVIWPGIGWSIYARILKRRGPPPEPKPVQGPWRALRIVVHVLCVLGVLCFMSIAVAYLFAWLKDGQ